MRKKWNVILGTILLIVACLCMSACTSSGDADGQKDKVNTEQGVEDSNTPDTQGSENEGSSMPDTEEQDDDYNWEEEESDGALIEDPEEGVIIEEEVLE